MAISQNSINDSINTFGTANTVIGTGTNTGTITVGNTNSGAVNINCGTAGINVGNTANAHLSVFGSNTGASATTIACGSGSMLIDGVGATNYTISNSTTTGTVTIGGIGQTGTITIGQTNTSTGQIINFNAAANDATGYTINMLTGNNANAAGTNQTFNLFTGTTRVGGASTRIVNIGSATNSTDTFNLISTTINISTNANAATLHLGDGAAVKTVTLGSTNSTSTTTVQSGSGALNVTSTNGALTINSGTGVLGVSTDASATTVNLATGGAVKTVTLGSTNSTSSLALKYGTTGTTLASASGTTMSATSGGNFTYPLNSCFLAYNGVANDVTGDGTVYTIICGTEIFDKNSNYNNGTGVFTAPVTGVYLFNATVWLSGLLSTHTSGQIRFVASSRTVVQNVCNTFAGAAGGTIQLSGTTYLDMTAGDTCSFAVVVFNGTKVVDILGDNTAGDTFFGGRLVQ